MKTTTIASVLGLVGTIAYAGTPCPTQCQAGGSVGTGGFSDAIRPITNPTLFDLAVPGTNLHPIWVHHRLPNTISLFNGANVPVGGEVDVYALQFEYALNERLSIVATKDGYIDADPNATLDDQSGFANLGAGLKYAFIYDPASSTVVSGTATFEVPTGNSEVFQGEGDGAVNLIVSGLKLVNDWQFSGAAGVQLPFSSQQSTTGFVSAHASWHLCKYFMPLVEANWYTVLDPGNGTRNFPKQVGGLVPAVVDFEGGDFFNLGAVHSGTNRDLFTAAVGFRSRLTEALDAGVAYEFPLSNDQNSLMKDRLTVDLIWRF